ncbi:tryptophan halogenase family protein [Paraglaciecola arctica]|uniref:Tryptophan halogenase n=1 Tax=Paraglaciecola arctica BSs20135 TaxID=493475 RepID=K6Z8P1_9ALTE|nr:tryptophan halogenase family protein [Paraglaciecola arctica]GAC19790.1 tryptophan halogenase [Paraglaciecola arctica BSs20135]
MNQSEFKKIVIVGGGTAGWLTACIIAAEHQCKHSQTVKLTLVESPQVSTIGVGEGTWPTMRSTLQNIGISEAEFFRCCDASFKQGSQFIGWLDGTKKDSYFHPFTVPHGLGQADLAKHWRKFNTDSSFADCVSFQPELCRLGLAPKQISTPEYAAVANYGYHLNAGKFADLLKTHGTQNLGIEHLSAHVEKIQSLPSGHIQAIETDKGTIEGDLFVDCTGMNALLIGKHFNVPWIPKHDILFNDSALATQLEYEPNNTQIASHTLSTAQSNGWIWDIGLTTRRGIGYVYSSRHCSDDEAELVLHKYLSDKTAGNYQQNTNIRKISFKPGYRQQFWIKNCVAVGMSAGFIEPLEASALALVELSAKMISQELPENFQMMAICAKRFNQRFTYRWERIIEFLKLHYVLSKRTDSDYWKENRDLNSIPERLQELITLWQYQPPSTNDFYDVEEVFPSSSYQYILYGMGFKPPTHVTSRRNSDFSKAAHFYQESKMLTQRYVAGLTSNRDLIKHIVSQGLPKH